MADNTFKFLCCHCRGKIRAAVDNSGLEATCPHCGGAIFVPRPGAMYSGQPAVEKIAPPAFVSDPLSEEAEETVVHDSRSPFEATTGTEQVVTNRPPPVAVATTFLDAGTAELLSPYDALLRNRLTAIALHDSWEWALARELLLAHLDPLRQAVFTTHAQATCPARPTELARHVQRLGDYEQQYLEVIQHLQEVAAAYASTVLFGEDPIEVGRFCATLGEDFIRLRQLHEVVVAAAFPEQAPFPELHAVIAGWAPAVWQVFNAWARQLGEHADRPRDIAPGLLPQLTVFPTSYPRYLALRGRLLARSA